jgi:hypothetical protein
MPGIMTATGRAAGSDAAQQDEFDRNRGDQVAAAK